MWKNGDGTPKSHSVGYEDQSEENEMRQGMKKARVGAACANLRALLRPFSNQKDESVSRRNSIIDAYIYNYDHNVSPNNHISHAQLDYRATQRQGGDTCVR